MEQQHKTRTSTMGSLPNLTELCREKATRRSAEKEFDLVRERARQFEFNRNETRNNKQSNVSNNSQVNY